MSGGVLDSSHCFPTVLSHFDSTLSHLLDRILARRQRVMPCCSCEQKSHRVPFHSVNDGNELLVTVGLSEHTGDLLRFQLLTAGPRSR